MNLHANHALQAANLMKINNPIGTAGEPAIPFVWKQTLTATSQKIQVEDQQLNPAGNPVGDQVKCSIYMPIYGTCNAVLN